MEWYWWLLIGVGVIVIGYFKLQIFKKLMSKKGQTLDDNE